jgi:SAM-dependent methyltransferase
MRPTEKYLHGYSPAEQKRLHAQAAVFAPVLHRELRFPRNTHLLEVGCGVGAQTAILLRNNPTLRITAVDLSECQLAAAREHFSRHPARHRVTFLAADATALPFPARTFTAALSIWFLEHVPAPLPILREIRRVLHPGSPLHLREVFNHSFALFPHSPACESYWHAYNALQRDLAGNPDIGIELPNLLAAAGFRRIALRREDITYDRTTSALRRTWLTYWRDLMLSGAPQLLARERLTAAHVAAIKKEFAALQKDPNSVFHFTPVFGTATS